MSDEEIILLYKNGEEEAFRELVNRYTSPIYNFVVRLANKNDASDIVQETFIKVWKNLNRFDDTKANFKTWIFTIAKNTATDFLRKKKSLLFTDLESNNEKDDNSFAENIPDEEILPDFALQKLEEKEMDEKFLNNLLEKLHPNYQEVLTLRYQEEMTFEEIGKILDKSLNTVKSQHRRAIIELRKMLEQSAPN
jgi:RNA polymerase sigma-70 factor (ECF subfamily)